MKIVKQISSLEKIRVEDALSCEEVFRKTCLKGERFSYQITAKSDELLTGKIEIVSPIAENVSVYNVLDAVMDKVVSDALDGDDNYITKEPGLMPDILSPIEERNNIFMMFSNNSTLWVDVSIPENIEAGIYSIECKYTDIETEEVIFSKIFEAEVIDKEILPQSLIYTRWFYADCIADYHRVEVYSEAHWKLIEEYIKQAVDVGVNMILVPVHTPPLDTAIGTARRCVQLVEIEKKGDKYLFEFSKFRRFIAICKKCGVQYYEIAHLFTQWGAKCAPNIEVTENGKTSYMFGWHTAAESEEYISFLKQYIAAISAALKEENISENAYFHISDEPVLDNIASYKRAYEIIKPLIGNSKTFDALSNYEFYEKGLVECPVTSVEHVNSFLGHGIKNLWVYYCCVPQKTYTNSFLSMPSDRVRILGVLMYKYDIKGFLHWGLNFYNGRVSRYKINPYVTTSADGMFPSGDPFILYPSEDGAYGCIRGKVTFDGITDMDVCRTLEQYIGRDEVIKMIDGIADMDVTFDNYPASKTYLPVLREKMIETIKTYERGDFND